MDDDSAFDAIWPYVEKATTEPTTDPQFVSLSESSSILEVVVKAHLFVEREITRAIEAAVPSPDMLNLERETFARKLRLMAALGLVMGGFYEPLQALNNTRNRLAHDLDAVVDPVALHALLPPHMRDVSPIDGMGEVDQLVTITVQLLMVCRVGYILARVGSPHTRRPLTEEWWKDL